MHKHETGKTRITLERLTVTTLRRGAAPQPVYCDICKKLIEPEGEPLLLEPAEKAADETEPINE
jgi:hypothetical protein